MALTASTFNVENIVFCEPKKIAIPGKNMPFRRIPIKYQYPADFHDKSLAGTVDMLHIMMPKLFSFGVQEEHDIMPEAGGKVAAGAKLQSYAVSLVMHAKDEVATKEEQDAIDMFEAIKAKVEEHLRKPQTARACEKAQLNSNLNVFYRKLDKGHLIPGVAPVLYPRLYTSKRNGESGDLTVTTKFVDDKYRELKIHQLIGKRCHMQCDIIFDNIYIGQTTKMQFKVNEAVVSMFSDERRSFLIGNNKPASACDDDDDDDELYKCQF